MAPANFLASGMKITVKTMLEIIDHEAIICEAYKDSKGIWTWGVGVTSASGHRVGRYKDNPQPISKVIEIFAWLLREKYAPDVLAAFKGRQLTEAQFTAALSFHYNTGAILDASWVKSWLAGNRERARDEFMNYRRPPEIIPGAPKSATCSLTVNGPDREKRRCIRSESRPINPHGQPPSALT